MLSTVRIAFDNAEDFIGQPATIHFTIPDKISPSFLLPINSVKIISEGEGEIQALVDGKIVPKKVRLGTMFGASIEVYTELDKNTTVIMTDVSNFNSTTHNLTTEKYSRNS